MRKLEHIASQVHFSACMHRGEPRSGLRLDVSTKQQPWARNPVERVDLDGDHKRHVVVALRAEAGARPDHGPDRTADSKRIAGARRLYRDPAVAERLEQGRHRGVAAFRVKHGVVEKDAADARVPCDIRECAQVIEIGVRDEDGLDRSAPLLDPRQKCARRDVPDRARATVEQHERWTRLDRDRGAIADREHGRVEVRGFAPRAAQERWHEQKGGESKPRPRPHDPPRRAEGDEARQRDGGAQRPVDSSDRDRAGAAADRELDQFDLKPRGKMERPPEDAEERRPDRRENRLRICEDEGHGGERRAKKRQRGPIRLQRSEVREHDRNARDERREA